MAVVKVPLKDRSYTVHVTRDDWQKTLNRAIDRSLDINSRIFVIFDAQVYALYGSAVLAALRKTKRTIIEVVVPAGEKSKSNRVLTDLQSFLLDNKVTRSDFILACGGGVVSDLSGFVAATILRGVRWGVLSTSLLGMVDAAIGGKTGINHKRGKNLIGAFWQPSFVVCDTAFLPTLSMRHLVAGLGEVVKYAGLAGGEFMGRVENYFDRGQLLDSRQLQRLIRLSAQYKADIVSRDEREGRLRMVLNLGHTFGHAIEQVLGYGRLLHGEAVLLGLDAAVELSCRLKPSRRKKLQPYQELVQRLFPAVPRRKIDGPALIDAMSLDKKRSTKGRRFVLLDAPGRPIISDAVPPAAIRFAVGEMLEHYHAKGVRKNV